MINYISAMKNSNFKYNLNKDITVLNCYTSIFKNIH